MHKFYTPEQIANILQLNTLTVNKYIREWKIKTVKLWRVYRITEDAFNEFIKKSYK